MATASAIFALLGIREAFVIGVSLHVFMFRKGEWDLYTTRILCLFGLLFGGLAFLLTTSKVVVGQSYQLWDPILSSLYVTSSVVAGTFSSIFVYRVGFHRLNRFPGPFAARLSNFYITRLSTKNSQLFKEIQGLHRIYGDIVRVGPSELSIVDARAFHAIYSNNSPCVKGPWYNIEQPAISLHMTRDQDDHTRRRKTWDRAFSVKALRDYEPRVVKYTSQLLGRIEETQGIPLDASQWFNFYSFDLMSDLAFGKSFNMLRDGVGHRFMKLVHKHMVLAGVFSHLIWMFPLFRAMPLANREDIDFQDWLIQQVQHREKNRPDVPDVFSWLLSDYEGLENKSQQDREINLYADMQLIAVAGSDTTATTLTCLFFLLATNKSACHKLQEEIDEFFATFYEPNHSSLPRLKYLQACIDETLRLFPVVPSGLQRMTPASGLQIADIFIPGNTIVTVPAYTLFFADPDAFIPERWTSEPKLVKDASVFAPFSIGRYSCVGKQLGLLEVRHVTSQVLHRFNIDLEHKDTAPAFLAGLKDRFTLASPGLKVVFKVRAD
ncbi:benzoate 4-monooxygenase cytochrome P450 [Ilyonectria robusta]|uniref:benzoate 4-monooxygenase cytochrome P450 n=1 Tax=Ilyonectria robusta TaxID=1079257 RepID=UPI001E8E86B7|nr:benzoate 4-monooxygenase cytochrome P450 [Ilyonectria robusta]KAH8734278.1 benzoate 4-monooxygenase cytochrome P450 [Ilyonectria robusta]